MGTFQPINQLIQDFSKSHGLGGRLLEVRLKEEWPKIVGQTIAKHSLPDSIRFHKLYLVTENSVWLQQLVFLKPTLLKALQELMPELELTDIVLRLGTLSAPMSRTEEAPFSAPSPSPEQIALADQLAKRLANPELREALRHTMAKGLSVSEE